MTNFETDLIEYALDKGFERIEESEITKDEFKEEREHNPFYSLIYRKIVNEHLFYILVPKDLMLGDFWLRVYHRFNEEALKSEYRIKVEDFIKYNQVYKDTKNPLADIIDNSFTDIYNQVLDYKIKSHDTNK